METYQTPYPKLDFFLLPSETIINMWESRIKFFSPRKVTLIVTNFRVIRIEKNVDSNISRSYEDMPLKDVTSIKTVTPPRDIVSAIMGYLGLIGLFFFTIIALADPPSLEFVAFCDSICFSFSLLLIILSKRVNKPIFISDEYREKDNLLDELTIRRNVTVLLPVMLLMMFVYLLILLTIALTVEVLVS